MDDTLTIRPHFRSFTWGLILDECPLSILLGPFIIYSGAPHDECEREHACPITT